MRKTVSLLLSLLFALSLLTGCGNFTDRTSNNNQSVPPAETEPVPVPAEPLPAEPVPGELPLGEPVPAEPEPDEQTIAEPAPLPDEIPAGQADDEALPSDAQTDVLYAESMVLTPADFTERTEAQAFAAVMAYREAIDPDMAITDAAFLWEASGWYAAWLNRTQGIDLLSREAIQEFQLSLGGDASSDDPEPLLGFRTPKTLRSSDGSAGYDFSEYKLRLDELLGVEIELAVTAGEALSDTVTVTRHYGYLAEARQIYTVSFEENPDKTSSFAYRFTGIGLPKAGPRTDPALTFTWDELVQANLLSSILTQYPSVCITNPMIGPEDSIRLFLHADEPVMISEGPDYLSGQYRGTYFELEETGDGGRRPVIGGFSGEDESAQLESFLLDYISEPAIIQLDRIEGDLIWADCIYDGGYRLKLAVDRGTLAVRQIIGISDGGEEMGTTAFDYQDEIRADMDYLFLYSWDRPLRTVTVTWENYYGGQQEERTETFSIPQDWELLPWEGRWGDYTIYMNHDYIGGYEYPGDGVDYYLFLTTVKG